MKFTFPTLRTFVLLFLIVGLLGCGSSRKQTPDGFGIPDSPTLFSPEHDRLINLAVRENLQKNHQLALIYLDSLLMIEPENTFVLFNKARTHLYLSEPRVALATLMKRDSLMPGTMRMHLWTHFLLTDSLYSLSDSVSFSIPKLAPKDSIDELSQWAEYCEVTRPIQVAAHAHEAVLKMDSSRSSSLSFLAAYYQGIQDFASSKKVMRRQLLRDPFDYFVWNRLGNTFAEELQFDSAIAALTIATRIRPENEIAWGNLAFAHLSNREYQAAYDAVHKAIAINSSFGFLYYIQGEASMALARYGEAIQSYQDGLKISPNAQEMILGLGNAYCAVHEFELALSAFDQTPEKYKESFEYLYGKTLAFTHLKRYAEALPHIMKAAEKWPQDQMILNNLADVLNNLQRPEEALIIVDSALGIQLPDSLAHKYLRVTRVEIQENLARLGGSTKK